MAAGELGCRRDGETAEESETTTVKRRKLEWTNRGGIKSDASSENGVVTVQEQCQIPSSECDLLDIASSSVSCSSSSNRSEEKPKLRMEDDSDQRETSWIYDNFNNRRDSEDDEESVNVERSKRKRCETVKEAELEDFFQAVEKDLRNDMLESSSKYNFDFEKDEPLGGRYEWLKFNP